MKVHIDARCPDFCELYKQSDADHNIEIPGSIEEFFEMIGQDNRFSLISPGAAIFYHKECTSHPTLWTLYFENDYD